MMRYTARTFHWRSGCLLREDPVELLLLLLPLRLRRERV